MDLINSIRAVIANGETEKAIEELIKVLKSRNDSKFIDTIILLSGQFQQLKQQEIIGIKADKNELRRIEYSLLQIISSIEKDSRRANISIFKVQRLLKLEAKISGLYSLLSDWEDKGDLTENPTEKKRCENEIEKVKLNLSKYEEEYNQLTLYRD